MRPLMRPMNKRQERHFAMIRHAILCVMLLALLGGLWPLAAQEPAERVIEVQHQGDRVRLDVPPAWRAEARQDDMLPFASMDNLTLAASDAPPTQVRLIVRHLDDLSLVLDHPLDPISNTPALDYLRLYARTQFADGQGVFAAPIDTSDARQTSAAMLYLERLETPRFGPDTNYALSLAFALDMPGDYLAVLLFEGRSTQGDDLLPLWGDLLGSLRFNSRPPAFATQPEALFASFLAPDELLARLRTARPTPRAAPTIARVPDLPGTPQRIRLGDDVVRFAQFDGWTLDDLAADGARLGSPAGDATLTVRLSTAPDEDDLAAVLDALQNAEQWTLLTTPATFRWDRWPGLVATWTATPDETRGQVVLMRLSGEPSLLTMRFEAAPDTPQTVLQTWFSTLLTMQINGTTAPLLDLGDALRAAGWPE